MHISSQHIFSSLVKHNKHTFPYESYSIWQLVCVVWVSGDAALLVCGSPGSAATPGGDARCEPDTVPG